MKRALDQALAELGPQVDGLQAVLISALPDGLLVWVWTRTGAPVAALEFAALDRSATACLRRLSASASTMELSLITDELRIFSWPLLPALSPEAEALDHRSGLVVNFVFDGEQLPGMAMAFGKRLRAQLRAALIQEGLFDRDPLHEVLVAALLEDDHPLALLVRLARAAQVELDALRTPRQLSDDQRGRIDAELDAVEAERASRALLLAGVDQGVIAGETSP